MTHIARPFSHFEILDTLGKPRTLESLCKETPVVIGFVRHFGCAPCEEQVMDLVAQKKEMESLGARLVIIGNGNPEHARNFSLRTGVENIYVDPARLVYAALGLKRSFRGTFGFRAARNTFLALRKGYRQGAFEGDPWQQGGTFVVSGERIAYAYRSQRVGDYAPLSEVLRALRELRISR